MAVRQLIPNTSSAPDLAALYAFPQSASGWWRAVMVSSVDGSATGATGLSGSINNDVDHEIFDLQRTLSDVVVVGASTAALEGYDAAAGPLVVVSQSGRMPEALVDSAAYLATCAASRAHAELPDERVIVAGDDDVDLVALKAALVARGWARVAFEGGPRLLALALAAGVIDDLSVTTVPQIVGGVHPRIVVGGDVGVELALAHLLESGGTLLARWVVGPSL